MSVEHAPGADRRGGVDPAHGLGELEASAANTGFGMPLQRACALIADSISPVTEHETIALGDAFERVLASDLLSPIDVPAHDNSAMDGYACRFDELQPDAPSELTVIGSALAGHPYAGPLPARATVRIMTGAIVPAGLDTIVPQELCRVDTDTVTLPAGIRRGDHFRHRGEDLARDQVAISAGRLLRASDIGLAASLGIAELRVRRRLRVACFSTGDELAEAGAPLRSGQIYDSNRFTLLALLRRLGAQATDLGIVRDDPASLERALSAAAADHDVLISSGGVSVGEADFTRATMARLGRVAFSKIAIRPGRPLAFGSVGDACYFGLPGNPVAVMVTYLFVVRPALLKRMGARIEPVPACAARLAAPIRKRAGRVEFQRAVLSYTVGDPIPSAALTGDQGSGVLNSMSRANCLLMLAHEQKDLAAGDLVTALPFDGLLG